MKKQTTSKTKKATYTRMEKNIYKTSSGTYRVRVGKYSENWDTLKEARAAKKWLIDYNKQQPVI